MGPPPDGVIEINPAWLTYRNGLVPELAKAAVTQEFQCTRCFGGPCDPSCPEPKTKTITAHIDPLQLAVLADALEEAGCADDGILGHLRATSEKCPTCDVHLDRITKHPDRPIPDFPCRDCNGSGTRSVSHIWTPSGGCHVLDMLLAAQREPEAGRAVAPLL